MLSVPALAAESGTENLVRSKTYTGQFSDLPEDHTFYKNVAALYEYGLSVGQADGTFGLTAPMTVGQTVIFAGRIRSLYRTGDPEAGPGRLCGGGCQPEGRPAGLCPLSLVSPIRGRIG